MSNKYDSFPEKSFVHKPKEVWQTVKSFFIWNIMVFIQTLASQ